jgi:hypothetical protein
MTDRLLESCSLEVERFLERQVEREFEALRALPNTITECAAPVTGDPCNPHDEENVAFHAKRAVQALLAARWWADKAAPRWAASVPLPLTLDEAVRLNNLGDRRLKYIGYYSLHLRDYGWDLPRCLPFEAFCAPGY